MNYVLEIVNDIERVSGITTFSNNFFKHKKLSDIKRKTINSKPSVDLCKKIFSSKSVYCHILYSIHLPVIVFLCLIFRKKLIIVSHGNLIVRDKSKLKKRVFLSVISFLSMFGDTITQFLNQTEFKRSVQITRQYVICPPFFALNSTKIKPKPKPKPKKVTKLLYMGANYYDRKGFDRMFKLCSAFRDEGLPCSLDLVGVLPTKKIDEAILSYNLGGVVKYLEPVFGDEKFSLMSGYDYLLLLSRSEGWPMVVLEAISVRLPLIVSKGTNISEKVVRYGVGVCLEDFSSAGNILPMSDMKLDFSNMISDHNKSEGFNKIKQELLCI